MLNENLIQALNTYTSTLEQHLAALEARVAQLEELLAEVKTQNDIANQQIATLQTEIVALTAAQAAIATETEEPEVEIELILDEETEEETAQETIANEEELVEENTTNETEATTEETTGDSVVEEAIEYTSQVIELKVCEPETVEPTIEAEEKEIEEDVTEETAEEPATESEETKTAQTLGNTASQPTLCGPAVSDIRQAISLGDRFLFQRELFAGNGEQMQKALEELNGLQSLTEAMSYITERYDWDMESTAAGLFVNVLKRRFN